MAGSQTLAVVSHAMPTFSAMSPTLVDEAHLRIEDGMILMYLYECLKKYTH
jgi:hypothetical protein